MGLFSKSKTTAKETVVRQVSAAALGTEIDNLTKAFTTTVTKLQAKATEANTLKAAKEAEITALQTECASLEAVSNRASNIADKIASLFN